MRSCDQNKRKLEQFYNQLHDKGYRDSAELRRAITFKMDLLRRANELIKNLSNDKVEDTMFNNETVNVAMSEICQFGLDNYFHGRPRYCSTLKNQHKTLDMMLDHPLYTRHILIRSSPHLPLELDGEITLFARDHELKLDLTDDLGIELTTL